MDSLFTSVLEISWQAGLIALAVMAVRPPPRRVYAVAAGSPAAAASRPIDSREPRQPPAARKPAHPGLSGASPAGKGLCFRPAGAAPGNGRTRCGTRLCAAGSAARHLADGRGLHGAVHGPQPAAYALAAPCRPPHTGQCLSLHRLVHALRAGCDHAPHLCAGNRVGAGLSSGARPRKVPYPPLGPCVETVGVSAAGGQLVQPGPLGGVCPAGPRHGARL